MGRQIYFLLSFSFSFPKFIYHTNSNKNTNSIFYRKYIYINYINHHHSFLQPTEKKLQHNLIEYSCFPFLFPELCEIKTRLFLQTINIKIYLSKLFFYIFLLMVSIISKAKCIICYRYLTDFIIYIIYEKKTQE